LNVLSAARSVHLHGRIIKKKIAKQTVDAFITTLASIGAVCVDI
jgi:uncharacterized protein (DUF849 family)